MPNVNNTTTDQTPALCRLLFVVSLCASFTDRTFCSTQKVKKNTPLSEETLEKGGALETLTVQFYVKGWFHQKGGAGHRD